MFQSCLKVDLVAQAFHAHFVPSESNRGCTRFLEHLIPSRHRPPDMSIDAETHTRAIAEISIGQQDIVAKYLQVKHELLSEGAG